jgi:hypothetical protein
MRGWITRSIGYTACLMLASSGTVIAQTVAGHSSRTVRRFEQPWVTIFTDPDFQIALDTSRIERVDADGYLVWMQTRWVTPRNGSTKRTSSPFDRELIHTFFKCDPIAYEVVRTVVFLDDGPPIDSVGADLQPARARAWRTARPGSADLGAGSAMCEIVRRRNGQREPRKAPPNTRPASRLAPRVLSPAEAGTYTLRK